MASSFILYLLSFISALFPNQGNKLIDNNVFNSNSTFTSKFDKFYSSEDTPNKEIVYIKDGAYKVINHNKNYSSHMNVDCLMGGEPLAMWGVEHDEIIDSSKDIKPYLVKKGYLASGINIVDFFKLNTTMKNEFHFNVSNPSYVGPNVSLKRENNESFYVNTAGYPPVLSHNSNQTVSAYKLNMRNVVIDDFSNQNLRASNNSNRIKPYDEIISNIPSPNYNYIASTNFLVFRTLDEIKYSSMSWDQLTEWSDYFHDNKQDLYQEIGAHVQGDSQFFYGFIVCGSNKETLDFKKEDSEEFKNNVSKNYELRDIIRGTSYITKHK